MLVERLRDGSYARKNDGVRVKLADGRVLAWDEVARGDAAGLAAFGLYRVANPSIPPGKAIADVTFREERGAVVIDSVSYFDLGPLPLRRDKLMAALMLQGLFDAFAAEAEKRPGLRNRLLYGVLIQNNDADLLACLSAIGFDIGLIRSRQVA